MAAKRKRAAGKSRAATAQAGARTTPRVSSRRTTPAPRRQKPAARRATPPARSTKAPVRRVKPAAPARKPRVASASPPGAAGGNYRAQHMDYTTHNLEEIKRFYGQVLGFSGLTHDRALNYVNVQTGPGSSLGFMPPMPGPPEQWRPPREPAIYFFVTDVDRLYRELAAKGVAFRQAPTDMPWGHRSDSVRSRRPHRVLGAVTRAPSAGMRGGS
jgi:predicted enzyme related to lactoylglutathione lyase